MNCRAIQKRFDDRLDARLAAAEQAEFDRHVAGCAACRRAWTAYAAAWEILGRHDAPPPSTGFTARTLRRLEEPQPDPGGRVAWPAWRWAALAVSVAALALGGWFTVQHWQQGQLARTYAAVHTNDYLDDFDVIVWLDQLEGGDAF